MRFAPIPHRSAREATRPLILQELARAHERRAVIVKGGVNLRLFFGSPRYSQDLDLDGEPDAAESIRACIKGVFGDRLFTRRLQALGIRGLDPGEGPNKDSGTTFRYKFGVIVPGDLRLPTEVEVSFRARHPADRSAVETPDEDLLAGYGLDPIPVCRYCWEAAVRQKIDALGGRREAQARDVFDLHVLLGHGDEQALLSFLAEGLAGERLREARARALTITFAEYMGQVVEFLDTAEQTRFASEDAWDDLRLGVAALIEKVLGRKEEG